MCNLILFERFSAKAVHEIPLFLRLRSSVFLTSALSLSRSARSGFTQGPFVVSVQLWSSDDHLAGRTPMWAAVRRPLPRPRSLWVTRFSVGSWTTVPVRCPPRGPRTAWTLSFLAGEGRTSGSALRNGEKTRSSWGRGRCFDAPWTVLAALRRHRGTGLHFGRWGCSDGSRRAVIYIF